MASAGKDGARRIVANLAGKAFRRPVTDADVNPLMKFYDKARKDGHSFDVGIRDSLSAILASLRSWRTG